MVFLPFSCPNCTTGQSVSGLLKTGCNFQWAQLAATTADSLQGPLHGGGGLLLGNGLSRGILYCPRTTLLFLYICGIHHGLHSTFFFFQFFDFETRKYVFEIFTYKFVTILLCLAIVPKIELVLVFEFEESISYVCTKNNTP